MSNVAPSGFLNQARALLPGAVALRRRVHRHPELGNELPRTRAAVLESLADLDLDIALSTTTSGIVATLSGAAPGPTILLRGDMDALPMPEDTGLEFASEVTGRMHACGHDAHTAMLATAARLLAARRGDLHGNVRFMFQPGEEGPGGAEPMIAEGLLDRGGRPDAAFALHIFPNIPAGVIASRPGPVLAAADFLDFTITGRGGHGSMPYDANDPIPVMCELMLAIQTFITRRIDTFDPVVFTAGQISAGSACNVIPEAATAHGTLRSFSSAMRQRTHDGIRRLTEHIAAAHGMRGDVGIKDGYPVTRNDPPFIDMVRRTTRDCLGESAWHEMPTPFMGAEDFAYVLERYSGAMAFLGVAPPGIDPAAAPACHSNRMTLDENALASGIALHAAVAVEFLNREASPDVAPG